MQNIADQVGEYWDGVDQDTIIAILDGVFSMTGTKNKEFVDAHTYDVTEKVDGKMSATTLNSATNKACGANKKKFTLVFMHSDVATNLENLNLVAHLKYTDSQGMQRELDLYTWNGKLVVIDDDMPTTEQEGFYIKAKSADEGALQVVANSATPTAKQIKLESVTPVADSYETPKEGDYVVYVDAFTEYTTLRLSQTVGNTERYIRDNVDEQGRFNQEISAGTQQANELTNTIKRAVAAYISIQSVGKALNISDELVQTTSRLNMMNDGVQTTAELVNMVYAAAQDARGSFSQMADVVARFGNNAKDAFSSSEEVVAFADLIQKQMTIAGASTQEAANAELQLSQALGSGVLRGDELNSIFEQAPNLIQNIADYLDVPIGKIREMAADGELSADVVKAAIFSAADDINSKFNEMPMTWGQIWQSMQNTALIAFQPVLQRLNDLANSEAFQTFIQGAIEAMATLANILLNVFEVAASVGAFIGDNWSIIAPIIYGVIAALGAYLAIMGIVNAITAISAAIDATKAAADALAAGQTFLWTVQQYGLNAALAACPITWIIVLIIALIAIIFAVCNAIAKMTGIANSGFGVITGGVNVVIQFFKNLGLTVANIALGIGNAIAALASNMMTAFHNAICSVQSWFYNLLSTALSVIEGICSALNKLPFVEFDYSGISSAADDYAAKASEAAGNKEDYQSISDAFNEGFTTFDAFQDGWASDAFNAGAAWGDGIADKVSNFSLSDVFGQTDIPNVGDYTSGFNDAIANSGVGDSIGNIDDNTGKIKDSLDVTEEDLKYLRDIAEQEAINRFTTAEINVDMSGMQNTVNSGDDIDGFMTKLTDSVNEAVDNMTEGVHE